MECIDERVEFRVKIIANQVKEMNLRLSVMKGKVELEKLRP